jgi:hypothetical protein
MTTLLITSTTENQIDFAAAILCSGGNISSEQAEIIASKGFPVYLVGNTSDFAAIGLPASLANLQAAGVDARMKLYPEGPVFDGEYYYGAHDSWNRGRLFCPYHLMLKRIPPYMWRILSIRDQYTKEDNSGLVKFVIDRPA